MAIKLPVGKTNFKEIREKGSYYVDKTRLLEEMLDSADKVTLITRPRRFGKSLMLSTLEEFFSIRNSKEDAQRLFEGLRIMERQDLVEQHMAQHPVLRFSFNGVDGASYRKLLNKIFDNMKEWCRNKSKMFDFDMCDEDDVDVFKRVKKGLSHPDYKDPDNGRRLLESDMESFLSVVIRMLNATYGKKAVVLLDEYDVPLAKASVLKGTVMIDDESIDPYTAMKKFIAGMLAPALKDNDEYVKLAVVTGCMRIAQASIFTGINNFSWYGIQDEVYEDLVGFTSLEVDRILHDAGIPERKQDFKEWYDGYLFGRAEIYCPWDVLRQVEILQQKPRQAMKAHWLGSSGNEILRQMLRNPEMDIEEDVAALIDGGDVIATLNDNVTYDILNDDKDNLWTVLYQTGYLTKKSPDENEKTISLVIPNKEVRLAYEEDIVKWMVERLDSSEAIHAMDALLAHKPEEAAGLLSKHLFESMSYFDYKEDFYHGLIGSYLKCKRYQLDLDKEYGLGRPDIVLYSANKARAVIIEVKHAKEADELAGKLKEAVDQCIKDQYIQGAKAKYKNVVCYGLVCYKKECRLQEVTENDTVDDLFQRIDMVFKTAKKS